MRIHNSPIILNDSNLEEDQESSCQKISASILTFFCCTKPASSNIQISRIQGEELMNTLSTWQAIRRGEQHAFKSNKVFPSCVIDPLNNPSIPDVIDSSIKSKDGSANFSSVSNSFKINSEKN